MEGNLGSSVILNSERIGPGNLKLGLAEVSVPNDRIIGVSEPMELSRLSRSTSKVGQSQDSMENGHDNLRRELSTQSPKYAISNQVPLFRAACRINGRSIRKNGFLQAGAGGV